MLKAILAAVVTIIVGIFAEGSWGVLWNMPGIGTMVSVAVMGAFIICFNEKKK